MNIQYTYEIISVDQTARCMEIVYSCEGRKTMHIGARLPYAGESAQDIVQMYAPVTYWLEQEQAVVVPNVGEKGSLVHSFEENQPNPNEVEL
jgi:hypothetical protein